MASKPAPAGGTPVGEPPAEERMAIERQVPAPEPSEHSTQLERLIHEVILPDLGVDTPAFLGFASGSGGGIRALPTSSMLITSIARSAYAASGSCSAAATARR